ncbi:MAG: isopeptide-forming domain-containing fimbrial protein [Chloroflexota bacterium]
MLGPLAPIMGGISSVVRADDVRVTQDPINGNECNGVVTTPGSENTNKRLIAGSLEPGGTATFEISFPVDAEDVGGDFRITDCVFIGDTAVAKYFIDFVPNNENFLLTFTLTIPSDAPVGDEYCNYAKTTESPSNSQASNRKAGPACFLIGGDLLIHKTDASGAPLAGADFTVACTWPITTAALAGTVITAQPNGTVQDGNDANSTNDSSESFTSTSGGSLSKTATTGSAGTIAVAAPVGTSCTFTETDPPTGYLADPNDLSETLVVTSGQQQSHTFVNTLPPAHLTIVKDLTGEVPTSAWGYTGDLGSFTLPAAGGSTDAYELVAGSYTINETTKTGYDVSVSCDNGDSGVASVSVDLDPGDDVTCTFYNVAQPGSITIIKSLDGDAPAGAWGYTGDLGSFDLPAGGGQQTFSDLGAGMYNVAETTKDGYTATVSCDSGESGSSSVAIDLDPGEDVICTFVNVADTSVTIDKSNDAEVEGDPGTVSRGDTVHFTIEVNIDGNDATNVVVTDTLPVGLTYVAASADPATTSVAGQVLTWDMGDLAQGQYFFSYDATVDENASGTLTNVGCIETDELAQELCDDSSVLVKQPAVSILKDNNTEGPVTRGSTVHYSLTVTVTDGPAHDVVITDALPAGIDYKTDTADPSAGFSLSLDGRTLTWDAGTLATGTYTFEYDGLVANDAPIGSDITNVGCVAASDDANTGEPAICDDSTVTVTPPSLTIDKSNNFEGEAVTRGQVIDYSVTVEVMDGPMQNAVITDTLPNGLTYVADSGSPEPDSVVGNVITWTAGELATGTHTFTYQASVDADAVGDLTNLACVDTDELDAELCDQTTVEVTPPSLDIVKDNNTEGPVSRGSMVEYTLTVTVTDGPLESAVITDSIPDGLTYVAGSADPMDGFEVDGQDLTWTTGSLDSGIYEFTYSALVDGDAAIGSSIVNTGCVSSEDDAEDGLICDDSEIEVKPSTVEFDKSSNFDGEFVLRGETIDYSLTVTVTDGPVHNAVITDTLPAGLTYLEDSADPATGFAADGQDLTWTLGTLENGTYEFSYSATVDADAIGELANLACIDVDETDSAICDQTTTDVRIPTLVIGKDADTETVALLFDAQGNLKSVTPNPVTWTLTWTMTNGPVTNAVITDVIPDGLTYVADSASDGGVYDAATHTVTWTFPSLSDASGTVSFETSTDADAAIGTPIENVAVIDSNETAPDDGRDSITVSEQSEQGSTGTPEPSVPDTASVSGPNGQPVTIPVELLMVLFLASLGTLATVNVRSVRRRR